MDLLRMKKTAPRGFGKDGKDRASWNYIFGPVQWRSRASWKQRAGWIFKFHVARSFLRISIWRVKNPSGAVPKSIWRVSFFGDFIVGKHIRVFKILQLLPFGASGLLRTGSTEHTSKSTSPTGGGGREEKVSF